MRDRRLIVFHDGVHLVLFAVPSLQTSPFTSLQHRFALKSAPSPKPFGRNIFLLLMFFIFHLEPLGALY